jgi:flagellar P-ring protein precursor FlgI
MKIDRFFRCLVVLCGVLTLWPAAAQSIRIKEIAAVQGVRSNQLTGYGLVVGLDGTGDQTTQMPYTTQSLNNYLQQLGLALPAGANIQLKNVAAVLVTAQLPAFAQPGQSIDVTVSSVGNAKSLRGGTLITTPLKGADGEIYALAQGNLLVGGAGASAGGSKVQINHLSAGRVPGGGQVERAVASPFALGEFIDLGLNSSDFQTAMRVTDAINRVMGAGVANAVDGRVVRLRAPADPSARVGFLAKVEEIRLEAAIPMARVIINSRTGSIVMNSAVTLGACAVSHGNLSVSISSTPVISQPNALSTGGQTVVTEQANIQITQDKGSLIKLDTAAQLSDVVRALNSLGATPQDLLAILQAIKASGAMNAELEVI